MANKQELKTSEARILVYLDITIHENKYVSQIAAKLDMSINYTNHILKVMEAKKWVTADIYPKKTYYKLTKQAPITKAKKELTK